MKRRLTLGEQAEFERMDEDEIINMHKLWVSNYFMVCRTWNKAEIEIAREEVEKIEMEHRKYYLYSRAIGREF